MQLLDLIGTGASREDATPLARACVFTFQGVPSLWRVYGLRRLLPRASGSSEDLDTLFAKYWEAVLVGISSVSRYPPEQTD